MYKDIEDNMNDFMFSLDELHQELSKIENWALVRKCECLQLDLISIVAQIKLEDERNV